MNMIHIASHQFEQLFNGGQNPQYIFHIPRQAKTYLGVGLAKSITCTYNTIKIVTPEKTIIKSVEEKIFDDINSHIDPSLPSFWIISPDLHRSTNDADIPIVACLQPNFELKIEKYPNKVDITNTLATAPATGWTTETDADFTARLKQGIERLQSFPDGKMIISRPYERNVSSRKPLDLFAIYAASEPAAACSHYFQISPNIVSLGCSPENVFEIDEGRLIFDVVAGTRGISSDPDTDARWMSALQNDLKERREHLMAFERYKARIQNLITPDTLKIERQLEVLQLGNVRHLYSSASGQLLDELDWFKILKNSLPALSSYPPALQSQSDESINPLRYYGGVVGRVANYGKDAKFYLNLRAALVKGDILYTQGGVGVIKESEAEKELLEVKNKLSGLFKSIAQWEL